MYAHNVPKRLARALAPRFAAGVVVTLALLSAACSNDSASRINAPPLLASMDKNHSAAASAPSLGTASSFAILSAADGGLGAVTCVGPATITGNVGSSGVITPGACVIIGAQIAPVSAGVVAAFDKAYAALAGQQCTQTILTEAYTNQTLSVNSGVICFPTAVTFTNSTLTLTGSGPWLFKIGSGTAGSGALTGTNLNVIMPSGANPCDVTWWVRAGATMTTDNDVNGTHFFGTILAGAGITVTGASIGTFNGRALAKAAVKITGGTFTGCTGGIFGGKDKDKDHEKCNQGVGNGPEGCDPGNSNQGDASRSNDERGGIPGNPGRKGGHDVDLSKGWKVYDIDAATLKWDIDKAAALPGGVAQFPFEQFVSTSSGSFAVYLLNNFNSDITGKTISANVAWDRRTFLTRGPDDPTAYVRLEFQDVGNGDFVSNDYWWSSVKLNLNAGTSGTLTSALTDRTLWTNICGQPATDVVAHPGLNCTGGTDPAVSPFDGFTNAMKNVKLAGLSFGRASRFASGVAVTVAPASFRLNSFTITP